jgi:hypothetical protein
MDNYHLRTTILKLLDRLSDHDRQRLHFLLANDVPRPIRDNASTSGTLYLMESLFDQDKLSEENFTILIDAFKGIKCIEGLKILKGMYISSLMIYRSFYYTRVRKNLIYVFIVIELFLSYPNAFFSHR